MIQPSAPAPQPAIHPVLGTRIDARPAVGQELVYLAAGCFWGVERIFWQLPGVVSTAVGYMGGTTPNPTYFQVGRGTTGHAETVRVVYDAGATSAAEIFAVFFENHDSTTANRQGGDIGTQYRSAIWTTTDAQYQAAVAVRDAYQLELNAQIGRSITTEIHRPPAPEFHFAEDYHQAYLHHNPAGYCNHGFNGVGCPRPVRD